ncbi:hypothetical protein MKW94_009600 [Papaver nudicaule]|nr:hypothetical protein [Papaver nudicaule]
MTLLSGSGVVLAKDTPTYCVVKSFGTDQNVVLAALNWVCARVDCSPLSQGGHCYNPDTVSAHASYAFNEYYHLSGMLTGTCDFNGTAMVTTTNPSHGTCTFSDHRSVDTSEQSIGLSIRFSRGTGAALIMFVMMITLVASA